MKHRGLKFLSLLLTLVMVLGLMPGMSLTAYAATYESGSVIISALTAGDILKSGVTVTAADGSYGFRVFIDGVEVISNKVQSYTTDKNYSVITAMDFGADSWILDLQPPAHTHSFTYSASGAAITATCTAGCPDGYNTNGITLTISAPTNLVCDDSAKAATLSGYPSTAPTGLAAAPTSISYNPGGTAPTTPGTYTASFTWGGATASVSFTLTANAYAVTLSGGENATTSGGVTTQSVTSGQAMTTVTYTANSGYTFPAFSNSTTNGVTLTRVSDTVVTVSGTPTANVNITVPDAAAIPTYTVTYKVINGTWLDGSTADKTETVASGAKPANVPTGMKPASGYTGGAWDKNPADATITEATTFTYTFGAIPTHTVTYRVVNGTWADGTTADKTETVASGAKPANVPTGMIPSAGYTGGAWSTNPADATITEATIFTYIFTATPTFNVTVSETPNGTVTASKTTATAGENITLTITPASGYQIQATTVTDVNNNNIPVSNNSFTMPAADVTVTVTFIQIPVSTYTVTVANTPNGTVTASKTTAAAGENITLTITPASGYQVQAITVTDVNNNNISVTNNSFTMPAANVFVTVTFIESSVQPTNYTVSFFANGGGGVMNPVTVPANTIYTLPTCGFTPPAGKQFKAWQLGSTEFAPGAAIKVDSNAEFVALWKDDEGSGESGHGGTTGDIVFIGGFGGAEEWDGGYVAPQRAWKVSLAPMVNGSAALGIMTGESTTTDMNVYPTTTIYVFPNPDPGFVLDKIIWSLIDGSASYDITEAKNFVMPAMDAVVYVTFRPAG